MKEPILLSWLSLIPFAVSAVVAEVIPPNPEPAVVPALQEWTGGQGKLDLAGAAIVIAPADESVLKPIAERMQAELAKLGLPRPEIQVATQPAKAPAYRLTLGELPKPQRQALLDEAYSLEITSSGVLASARTPTGVFYATRTLLQMLTQCDPKAPALPCGKVLDYPQYAHRMLMLDVGRKPFPIPALQDFLRMMAWFKMNELHLHLSDEAFGGGYTGFRVECETFPGLASKDLHYTKKELRELQDVARGLGITITPEIDMPGHARVFTDYWPDLKMTNQSPSYMDVTNPLTVERMKKLLDEMIPIFDAPDFHIGTDEYRVGGAKEQKERLHEAFRKFINTINAHIRSKGKITRIWSGFEHMLGTTDVDPTVIIDMWETDNARGQIEKGHSIINSNHGRTYIVPGAHYYGVSNPGIYNGWEPWMVSGDAAKNPKPEDPRLLGGKLHVWNDQGPTGYTITEIAELTRPSLMAFAEKLWGRKGSKDYTEFQGRTALVEKIPGVALFDRIPADTNGVVLAFPRELTIGGDSAQVEFANAARPRTDLEWPWTLTLEIRRSADIQSPGFILSSDQAAICANYVRAEEKQTKDPSTGKEIKTPVERHGIGIVRAAGSPGATPQESHLARDVSRIYADPLPLNEWVSLAIVGNQRKTSVYVNGKLAGETGEQMLCPLARLGGKNGGSFLGSVRNLKLVNRALSAKEVGRAAGLDIPDNLAEGCKVTATVSDEAHGFSPSLAADGQTGTRWSSGPTGAEQSLTLDLGAEKACNTVRIQWEVAYPRSYAIAVSSDQATWKEVGRGEAREGVTELAFATVPARYVRVIMSNPATGWGYSIWEAEILSRTNQSTSMISP